MRRFPLKARVPFEGQLMTIMNRTGDAHTTLYTLHGHSATGVLQMHTCVPHSRLVQEIAGYARYAVGQLVYIDARWLQFRILGRVWNVRQCTVVYTVVDAKQIVKRAYFTQEQLRAAEALHEVQDTPPASLPEGYWDLAPDW
jgi:hypothetical protein